jgi:hypothetical protein
LSINGAPAAGSASLLTVSSASILTDSAYICVAIFR